MSTGQHPRDAAPLSADEQELLELLLQEEGISLPSATALTRRADPSFRPLSSAQERLWFLEQLSPGTATFHVPHARLIRGPLDVALFEDSVAAVVRRHEVLQASFGVVDGRPQQTLRFPDRPLFRVLDVRDVPVAEREARITTELGLLARQPFDLATGPLWRMALVRCSAEEHIWAVVMHHIISDGRSLDILVSDVAAVYEALLHGRSPALPPLDIDYADYAVWERSALDASMLAGHLDYWKQQLGGPLPVLHWPTGRRPPVQTARGATLGFELPPELATSIRTRASAEGVTPFMFLLSGYALLLGRVCGADDLTVSTPTLNRKNPQVLDLVGFFVNTLVLRIRLSGCRTIRDLLHEVRNTLVEAFEHDDVTFEKLMEVLRPARDVSRPALRQVAFAMNMVPGEPITAGPLTILPWTGDIDMGTARLDAAVFFWEEVDRIRGLWEYNVDILDPEFVARLSEQYQAVLADMAADVDRPIGPLTAAQREDRTNLTENQKLFWFSRKLQPDIELYFERVITTLAIEGEVDGARMGAALAHVVSRSDALRSVIEEDDGVPVRRVIDSPMHELALVDLSGEPDPQAALGRWLEGMRATPLDTSVQLFRSALVKLGPASSVWYLDIHHLSMDLYSLHLLVNQVAAAYAAAYREGAGVLEPARPYQDYVAVERAFRTSEKFARNERYWQAKLERRPVVPRFYRTSSAAASTRTERISCDLTRERTEAIRNLCQKHGLLSPAVVIKTVLYSYLHRTTGEKLLRIGVPFASRPREFSNTIGLFVSICFMDVEIGERESFASLAGKVQAEMLDVMRHQDYALRNPAGERIYSVYFNYQNMSFPEFAGLPVRFQMLHSQHSNDALTVQLQDFAGAGSLVLDIDFHCDAFDDGERQRTTRHLLRFLDALLADPDTELGAVDLLLPEEKALIATYNDTARDYELDVCLHQLIERQCAATPDHIAVWFEDTQLTYRELDQRTETLTRRLRGLGVGPGVAVGVFMERSIEMVVALVGILRAGGAYLPLDPAYPQERCAYMLGDARVPVLLSQKRLIERLPSHTARVVCLDADSEPDMGPGDEPEGRQAAPDDVAYIIYTSGSTGQPKGVQVPHRGICNRLIWMQEAYGLTPADRVMQKTPFSFDVSVWEFFWPLMTGACLVVARPGGHQDPSYLAGLIAHTGVTHIHFVPSMLEAFLEQADTASCRSLTRVICSGEALGHELQQRFIARMSAELHNLYGPTEASVDVTAWHCRPQVHPGIVPIGKPIANIRIYIVDAGQRLLPPGLVGEICLAGVGLAIGYLNKPELTAERFVVRSLPDGRSERLYRTGDLGRYLDDGSIEYLGRVDHQIKIRGFRIELGEIEAVLARHPAVREVVVIMREDRPGDKRLVAYVVAGNGHSVDVGELRRYLQQFLPAYMVPAAFVLLPAIPLSPNGKADRKALPRPESVQAGGHDFVAPRTRLEKLIGEIWCEVLGVAEVDVRQSFFDLGGHSLLATQVVARVNRALPVHVPLSLIFEAPVLEVFVRRLDELCGSRTETESAATELLDMMAEMSDEEIEALLQRGDN